MKIHEIENYRKFNVSILRPTNEKGTRVKISEPKRYNNAKTRTIILSYGCKKNIIFRRCEIC